MYVENTDFNHAFFKVLRYIYFHKNINKKNWFLLSWREYVFSFPFRVVISIYKCNINI